MNQELHDYIIRKLNQGTDSKQLKKTLLNSGWKKSDIDQAFIKVTESNIKQLRVASGGGNRMWIIIGAFLEVSILVIIGAYYYNQTYLKQSENLSAPADSEIQQTEAVQATVREWELEDSSNCLSTHTDEMELVLCHTETAIKTNESFHCSKISDIDYQYLCYVGIAEAQKATDECRYIHDNFFKDVCVSAVAVSSNDLSVCDQTKDSVFREACVYYFHNRETLMVQDITKIGRAANARDPSVCENLGFEYFRNLCYSQVPTR